MIFDVPGKDYYKVCLVQTIDNTPTEVGGIKTTLDVGEGYYVNVLNKTTLGGIQGILNTHQESSLLSIGDEVEITVNGNSWTTQIARIDSTNHAIDFIFKNLYEITAFDNAERTYPNSQLRTRLQSIYNLIDSRDRQYLKDTTKLAYNGAGSYDTYVDKLWTPEIGEVCGTDVTVSQLDIFVTQANRIRQYNGTTYAWWSTQSKYGNLPQAGIITVAGSYTYTAKNSPNNNVGILPCFRLTADS